MIPLFKVGMSGLAPKYVARTLQSGYIGQGPKVDEFEREFEKFNNLPPGSFVSTNSCTAAIELVLRYLNIGPGAKVVSTPMTCIATNAPVLNRGASLIWGGVTDEGLLDQLSLEHVTLADAIIGVDWTGRVANYPALKRRLNVPVIQDAAHNPDISLYEHDELGDYVCFSFGPIKHLTTIDGGGIFVNQPDVQYREQIVGQLKLLRWYGLDRTSSKDFRCEQDIYDAGMKWHMNDVSATVGLANLRNLRDIIEAHRQNAFYLYHHIKNSWITVPQYDGRSNYWVFPLLLAMDVRDKFVEFLNAHGIAASQVHARNDKHPAYKFPSTGLQSVALFDAQQVNIPCGWWLGKPDLELITSIVNEFKP